MTIVAMTIIYHFAHQCQRLKQTHIICFLAWLCSIVSYSVSEVVKVFQTGHLVFEKYCSIGDCHVRGMKKIWFMYLFVQLTLYF